MLIPWTISEWLPACTAQGRTLGSRFLAWLAQPFAWQLWQCGEGFICVPGVSVGMQSPEHPSHPESLQEKTTAVSWDGDRGWQGHSRLSGLAHIRGQTGMSWGWGQRVARAQLALGAGSHLGTNRRVLPEPRTRLSPLHTHTHVHTHTCAHWALPRSLGHVPHVCAGPGRAGSCLPAAPHPDGLQPFQGEMELTKSLSVRSVRESSLFFSICSCLPLSKPKLDASAFVF